MDESGRSVAPLRFTREPLITPDQAAHVHEQAKRILQEVGLEVRHAGVLQRLQAEGFRVSGERVFFEPAVVDGFVEQMRQWIHPHPDPLPGRERGRGSWPRTDHPRRVGSLDLHACGVRHGSPRR